MKDLTVSIITVSFNSKKTISDTINSVLVQTYPYIEYIIIDGSSTDGACELIKSYGSRVNKFVSEPDNGIYDAINKGIKLATGDIIGILNSDDFFYNNQVIENLVSVFMDNTIDAVYGDIQFVKRNDSTRIVRHYSSEKFDISKFKYGFMPAHPSFYVKRELFEKFGYFKSDYLIAADFELLIRFMFVNRIICRYINMIFVKMRIGGVSNKSILNRIILNKEIHRACTENGVKTNYINIYSKYFAKFFEFRVKKK